MRNRLATAVLALGLTACATLPSGKPAPGDPFERVNRSIWTFNNAVDHAVLRPVASGYVRYLPHPVRQSIHNFVTNVEYSSTVVNDLLQGKFNDCANDAARLVVNTIFGIGGLFDPASHMSLDRHDTDFGETLGVWGLDPGPYVMLPILGPSDVRDAFGRGVDTYLRPYPYVANQWAAWSTWAVGEIDTRAALLPQNQLIDSAFDSYAFVRNAYEQQRRFKIHGTQAETPQQLFPGLDDSGDSGTGGGDSGGPRGAGASAPATPGNNPPPSTVPPR